MPSTPALRATRSSSNPNNSISLTDVKLWIESSEAKILSSLGSDLSKISGLLECLTKRVEDVELKNVKLERRCALLEGNNSVLSAELKRLRDSTENLKSEILEDAVKESINRGRRLQSLVIQGVPESLTGSLEERKRYDIGQMKRILCELELPESVVSDVRRVGRKRSDGSRLMVVRMCDYDSRMKILSKSKSLKNSHSMRQVFIKPDMTPMQQAQDKCLRDTLRERRANGEDVIIFRGEVRARSDIQNFH